ncbi:MAG: hypothetical protein HOO94_07410 [Novosphingobium sp.]|uniref:hypothetical protein n=1 Tax=Novosphingobium sp. TaxID=1874826 RepID=UPI00179F01FC|nr:hypothetical protein [Novosphingobium sp.]
MQLEEEGWAQPSGLGVDAALAPPLRRHGLQTKRIFANLSAAFVKLPQTDRRRVDLSAGPATACRNCDGRIGSRSERPWHVTGDDDGILELLDQA